MPAFVADGDGLAIAVRVTPRAGRAVLVAATDAHFAACVSAPPVEGAANAAVVELVAATFRVSRRAVRLLAGDRARIKRLHIAGDPAVLAGIAASLYAQSNDG